jgi:hypothetical protein
MANDVLCSINDSVSGHQWPWPFLTANICLNIHEIEKKNYSSYNMTEFSRKKNNIKLLSMNFILGKISFRDIYVPRYSKCRFEMPAFADELYKIR